jgi:hypothetical protein
MTVDRGLARAPDRSRRLRLRGDTRRLVRLAHQSAALGWLGVDVVLGVLAVTGFTSDDPATVAACYIALHTFAVPLLLIFGLTTLVSGLVLSIGGGYGLMRYWWVVVKLVINLILSSLVLIALRPIVNTAAIEAARIDPTLADRLGRIPTDLLFPAFVSGVAIITASVLGTLKPWGRTPFGRGK